MAKKRKKDKAISIGPLVPHRGKTPKLEDNLNPDAFWDMKPSWCFHRADQDHERWHIRHEVLDDRFFKKLVDYERQTWGEILSSTSGKSGGTRNHEISISELCKDAQNRWEEKQLGHQDSLCSLRIGSRHRWWGILEGGVFHFIWNDPHHDIYPLKSR